MKRIMQIMKVILPIVLVFAVGGYFVYSYFEGKARERVGRKAEQERTQRLRESTRAAIDKMVSKFDAIDNWDEKLSKIVGEREIFTMELQNLWLTDRPILFVGKVEDAANTDDQDAYSISIVYFGKFWVDFSNRLTLSLRCPKTLFDSFLKEHPKAFSKYPNDVAVIANIDKVNTHFQEVVKVYKKGHEEEDREEHKKRELVGIGLCLDIVELPIDVFP
jgi:hypothetical protein